MVAHYLVSFSQNTSIRIWDRMEKWAYCQSPGEYENIWETRDETATEGLKLHSWCSLILMKSQGWVLEGVFVFLLLFVDKSGSG